MISPDTAAWLRSLPHPDDKEAWDARCAAMFTNALNTIPKPEEPLPWDEEESE